MDLAQNHIQWQALILVVCKLCVPQPGNQLFTKYVDRKSETQKSEREYAKSYFPFIPKTWNIYRLKWYHYSNHFLISTNGFTVILWTSYREYAVHSQSVILSDMGNVPGCFISQMISLWSMWTLSIYVLVYKAVWRWPDLFLREIPVNQF